MTAIHRTRPDNFTPPSRTPWGGQTILRRFKAGLGLTLDPALTVGESWEISTEPSFPTVLESGARLGDLIAANPREWLADSVAAEHGGCPLLVKLIDAAANLSVQVHPTEDHALLAEGESGKTEAWIILHTAPGARLYLGFRDGVTEAGVEDCLRRGGELSEQMNEVPIQPGDVFFIRPGLAHAIGAGTTLLEPQRVRPHRRAMTYRFWDWNRRYDADGNEDPSGAPRPLHIREALASTDWRGPRGAALVNGCRRHPRRLGVGNGLTRWRLLDEPELWAERWIGSGSARLPGVGTLLGVVCLAGNAELSWDGRSIALVTGQSAVVPAALDQVSARLVDAHLALCAVPPRQLATSN
jgi:mannose-6-phosphate isomerase